MHYLSFYFLSSITIILFIIGILSRRYSIILISFICSIICSIASLNIEFPHIFIDNNTIIKHTEVIIDYTLSLFFVIICVANLLAALYLAFYFEKY